MDNYNDGLSGAFAQYRAACPDPEPSPNFFPQLWAKIDARRSFVWKVRTYSRGIAAAAVTACLLMVGFEMASSGPNREADAVSYLEVLDENSPVQNYGLVLASHEAESSQ